MCAHFKTAIFLCFSWQSREEGVGRVRPVSPVEGPFLFPPQKLRSAGQCSGSSQGPNTGIK